VQHPPPRKKEGVLSSIGKKPLRRRKEKEKGGKEPIYIVYQRGEKRGTIFLCQIQRKNKGRRNCEKKKKGKEDEVLPFRRPHQKIKGTSSSTCAEKKKRRLKASKKRRV